MGFEQQVQKLIEELSTFGISITEDEEQNILHLYRACFRTTNFSFTPRVAKSSISY